jgi:tetratricopeptide (TPR) repeat protein
MYLDQILQKPNPLINAYYRKAEILIESKQEQLAIDVLDMLINVNNERLNHPVFKLTARQDKALKKNNHKLYDKLRDEIAMVLEQYGTPAPSLSQSCMFEVYYLQGQAYETLDQWEIAMECYITAQDAVDHQLLQKLDLDRVFLFCKSLGRCWYMIEEYHNAIQALNVAIKTNRQFAGVHKYKVLSLIKLRQYTYAVQTAAQAVLYESPWNQDNQTLNLTMYTELYSKYN